MMTRDGFACDGVTRWTLGTLGATILVICVAFAGIAFGKPSEHPFEIVPGSFQVSSSMGSAGAHADLTVAFEFAHESDGRTFNDARTVSVNLPPGFIGNSTAVPTCTVAELVGNDAIGENGNPECAPASQVGVIGFECIGCAGGGPVLEQLSVPVYNMEVTSFGVAAELGFNVAGVLVQVVTASLRPGDSGITATSANIEKVGEVHRVSITTWGLPASHIHDSQRGLECYSSHVPACSRGGESANIPVEPFLANPTSCEPHLASVVAYSWEHPEESEWAVAQAETTPTTECDRVPFGPSIETSPTTRAAESSSGLNLSLVVPQTWENQSGIASAHLKDTMVALPVGYTANPSLATGLGVCSPAQYEAETASSAPGTGCPPESKIGTVDVETPVLLEKLAGAVYVAEPYNNRSEFGTAEHPGGSLLALYIIVKDPARGIIVKLAGKIEPNSVTGQLVTVFDNSPQVPFSRFTLKLRQGAASPLVSPPTCGSYAAEADLTPWSAPLGPALRVLSSPPVRIDEGVGGGPCPLDDVPPFKPGILAGTVNNSAAAYTQMDVRVTRNDGEQEITRFTASLPPGLTANLTGVPFCPDVSIEAAKRLSGAQEEAEPSCPKASEIGHSLVGAGVGSVLAYASGKVYMAGPYNGAPFSIVAITSAKVGPFDLGTVVVREALDIDRETAVVTVDSKASDPIPHIIKGIVVHVRDIRVYIDRSHFTINPSNCNPLSFVATVDGAGADPTNPADQVPVTVSNRFQVANCRDLEFKPSFKVWTSGKTSRGNGATLSVKLTYPAALQGTQANIRAVKVDLPRELPSRLTTLQKACSDKTFNVNPAACPIGSRVGRAKAITPILPVPLTGPAYFVSHGGAKFPELVIVLQGYGVTLNLRAETFISKKGVTSSTLRRVPDDPVGSFELILPQGPSSALAANGNLCKTKLAMPTVFTAQNGAVMRRTTRINVTHCGKRKQRRAGGKHR